MVWNQKRMDGSDADTTDEFYDADDQKYLNIQKLDRIKIIFIQMLKCSQMASIDPRGKGKNIKQVIGRAIPIIQDIWVDDPHVSYYYAVRQLYVLIYPEFKINKEYIDKYNDLLKKWNTNKKPKYDYAYTERLHRLIVDFIEERYGKEISITDRVD
jgi:hypothetical protein